MEDKSRERVLEAALFRLYQDYAERFQQMIVPGCVRYKGGVPAVEGIVSRRPAGFERLKPYPHLTVEYLVASGDWDDLIAERCRKTALARLAGLLSRSDSR